MTDIINLTAERETRDGPDADCITYDEYGRPLYTFGVEYRRGDKTYSFNFPAYSWEDALEAVAAMSNGLTLVGQVMARVPL